MKKIKILFGINKLHVGGGERLVLYQLEHIDRDRFNPYLATFLPSTEPNFDEEAKRMRIPWQRFSFKSFFDLAALWKVYRFLRREKFDVVIANLYFTQVVLRIAAIVARVPVIISSEFNMYTPEDQKRVHIEKILARFTDRIVAVSSDVLESAQRRLKLPKEKFALTYSPVDINPARYTFPPEEQEALRRKWGFGPHDIVITTAGRLVEQKGQKYLVEAFARLVAPGDILLWLVIFGEGPLRANLLKQIAALNLENKVSLPGVSTRKEIMALTDIFVLPSLWEGLSLVLLEAMADGRPIVATDVSGSREAIVDGKNGFLVPPKDIDALVEKISLLAHDEVLRFQLGKEAQREAQKFSIENHLKSLYEVIGSVTAKR